MSAHRTVVMADLSGSSRLFGLLGTEAAARFMTQCLDAMATLSQRHGGRVVKRLGDGVLLLFGAAPEALAACVALQRDHQRSLARGPAELRLPLRIGLACGELAMLGDDCYGEAVNLAARLSQLAGEGQVWATESVFEGQAATVRARDLGCLALRGIAGARRLFQIEWDDGADSGLLTLHGELAPVPATSHGASIELRRADQQAAFAAASLPIHIGRSGEADFVVRESVVSRRHASIERREGSFLLTDLSSYGTWLRPHGSANELPLRRTSCVLHGRGEIALGAPFGSPGVPVVSFSVTETG
ncbi:adenylate/guanylate cyclase domain-containing protein [Ramlibacter sp. 2FC]|uniref:adenylate/guanylate cyclase domain-containing protein n=1 Tax=Ramlibacter sp. 2FC TaxID=2502188 RepID=UPI001485739E|nr:adenylate/guanylate cyclase domain-containing protein [Ramlibacter sp. 2FC]